MFITSTHRLHRFLSAAAVIALCTATSQAEIIALFTINDIGTHNNGTTLSTKGSGTLTFVEDGGSLIDQDGQVGIDFIDADGTNHPGGTPGGSAAWTVGVLNGSLISEDYWLLTVSTSGYQNVVLRFDYRITNVSAQQIGPSTLTLEYAVNGGGFNPLTTLSLMQINNWVEASYDLSALGLDNTNQIQIRGTWSNDGVGTMSARLDNVQVTANLIPEPSSIAILSLSATLLARRRHRF